MFVPKKVLSLSTGLVSYEADVLVYKRLYAFTVGSVTEGLRRVKDVGKVTNKPGGAKAKQSKGA